MGYSKRKIPAGHQITSYWPDDNENEIYLSEDFTPSLDELIQKVKEKWPDAKFEDITIEPEHIHTDCLYYDQYDPTDHTNFIVIRYNP